MAEPNRTLMLRAVGDAVQRRDHDFANPVGLDSHWGVCHDLGEAAVDECLKWVKKVLHDRADVALDHNTRIYFRMASDFLERELGGKE